ncbi:MAG TPA: glycosyl hydrolase-related protein, partial [Vicinamibacteria bacterium]|nr:glycosyl hydrolase-related protein [Vicinamibacteria bacterium]
VSAGPLHSFVDAGDAGRGMTVLAEGLTEFEVTGDGPPRLALTLLRSVGWLSRDDLSTRRGNAGPSLATPGAQCLGPRRFRFAAIPRLAPPDAAGLYKDARAFLAPPRLAGPAGRDGRLPGRHTFLEATGPVVLSALKRADDRDALVLRVFNPGPAPARLSLERDADAFVCDLGEKRVGPVHASDGRLEVALAGHQVKTIEVP